MSSKRTRRRADDDSGEYEPPSRKSGLSPNTILLGLIAFVVLSVVAGCGGLAMIFFYEAGKGAENAAKREADRLAAMTYTPVAPVAFMDEWAANPAAAQAKYATSGVDLTARLVRISGFDSEVRFELFEPKGWSRDRIVVVAKSDKAKAGLKLCQVGDSVRILARSGDYLDEHPHLIADDVQPVK